MSRASTGKSPTPNGAIPEGAGRWPLDLTSLLEIAGIYAVLSAIGIAMGSLAISWSESSPERSLDESTVQWWKTRRSTTLDALTDVGSSLADTAVLGAMAVALFLAMVFLWQLRTSATAFGLALGLEVVVFLTVSAAVGRSRPEVEQLDPAPPTASFPSGHVGATVAFTAIITAIVWNWGHSALRALAVTSALALPMIVALSRMYRGMHFLSDVVGGALLGASGAAAAWVIVNRALERKAIEKGSA